MEAGSCHLSNSEHWKPLSITYREERQACFKYCVSTMFELVD
jgi:hypothetical protein